MKTTTTKNFTLEATDRVISIVKNLPVQEKKAINKIEEGKKLMAEGEKELASIQHKKDVLSELVEGAVRNIFSGNMKGRALGAKDIKRRFRRTKSEIAQGLSLTEAKKLRRQAS
jgi:hypothetical protein